MSHRGRREHLAEKERTQPSRTLLDHPSERDLGVGLVERLHAAELLNVFRRLTDDRVDDVVHGDDPHNVPPFVDHRDREQVVLRDDARDFLPIRCRRDRYRLPSVTDVDDERRTIGHDQLAKRDDVHEATVLGLEHVDGIHRLLRASDLADVIQRLLRRPRCRHRNELGRHDAAGGVGRVAE